VDRPCEDSRRLRPDGARDFRVRCGEYGVWCRCLQMAVLRSDQTHSATQLLLADVLESESVQELAADFVWAILLGASMKDPPPPPSEQQQQPDEQAAALAASLGLLERLESAEATLRANQTTQTTQRWQRRARPPVAAAVVVPPPPPPQEEGEGEGGRGDPAAHSSVAHGEAMMTQRPPLSDTHAAVATSTSDEAADHGLRAADHGIRAADHGIRATEPQQSDDGGWFFVPRRVSRWWAGGPRGPGPGPEAEAEAAEVTVQGARAWTGQNRQQLEQDGEAAAAVMAALRPLLARLDAAEAVVLERQLANHHPRGGTQRRRRRRPGTSRQGWPPAHHTRQPPPPGPAEPAEPEAVTEGRRLLAARVARAEAKAKALQLPLARAAAPAAGPATAAGPHEQQQQQQQQQLAGDAEAELHAAAELEAIRQILARLERIDSSLERADLSDVRSRRSRRRR
jgi:hypothetical protein